MKVYKRGTFFVKNGIYKGKRLDLVRSLLVQKFVEFSPPPTPTPTPGAVVVVVS